MKIYVGNLSFTTTEDIVRSRFEGYGDVSEVAVITDRETGRSRGFAFVTMNDDEDAKRAIDELNGAEVDGRRIVVNEARPRAGGRTGGGAGGGRGSRRDAW